MKTEKKKKRKKGEDKKRWGKSGEKEEGLMR